MKFIDVGFLCLNQFIHYMPGIKKNKDIIENIIKHNFIHSRWLSFQNLSSSENFAPNIIL